DHQRTGYLSHQAFQAEIPAKQRQHMEMAKIIPPEGINTSANNSKTAANSRTTAQIDTSIFAAIPISGQMFEGAPECGATAHTPCAFPTSDTLLDSQLKWH